MTVGLGEWVVPVTLYIVGIVYVVYLQYFPNADTELIIIGRQEILKEKIN